MFPMPRGPYTKVGWARMRKRFGSTFFLNRFRKYEGKGSKVARELEHYWIEAGKGDGGKSGKLGRNIALDLAREKNGGEK